MKEGHKHTQRKEWQRWLMMNMPSMTHFHIRLEQRFKCCYEWILFSSVHLRSFCAFMTFREHKWLNRVFKQKKSIMSSQFHPVLFPMWQSDPIKRQTFGTVEAPNRPAEWRCPWVQLGQPIHTIHSPCVSTFTWFLFPSSAPLRSLVSGRV